MAKRHQLLNKDITSFIPSDGDFPEWFYQLENYRFAYSRKYKQYTNEQIGIAVKNIICNAVNYKNTVNEVNSEKIVPSQLSLEEIEHYFERYDFLYKMCYDDDYYANELATVFRLYDYFDCPELKMIADYIYETEFHLGESITCYNLFFYCRSDYFVTHTEDTFLLPAFRCATEPVFINGEKHEPWAILSDDYRKKAGDNITIAAGFLFAWLRCKSRFAKDTTFYNYCVELERKAKSLLIETQKVDGSWDISTTRRTEWDIEPTEMAVHALSLLEDESIKPKVNKALDWLIDKWENADISFDLCHAYSITMDAIFLAKEAKTKVSFDTEGVLPEVRSGFPKASISFDHLSDIHFCPDYEYGTDEGLRDELVVELEKISSTKEITDLIITGDYRHARTQLSEDDAVRIAVGFIKQLAKAVKIDDSRHIHLVPGNHDIDRKYLACSIDGDSSKSKYEYYREKYKERKGIFPEEAIDTFLEQRSFFSKICHEVYKENNPWNNKLHAYRVVDGTVFLYLDSSFYHHSDDDRGKLLLCHSEVYKLLKEIQNTVGSKPIVVLAHHAIEYLDNSERIKIEHMFAKYPVSYYLCGDSHAPDWRVTNGWIELTAGCVKDQNSVEFSAEFNTGNTSNNSIIAYKWTEDFGWGRFESFNESLSNLLLKTGMKVL